MKKTMIAMAVAGVVAAPIASAEVAISGVVEQTFTDTSATAWNGSTDSSITFSASEDLGNGMTAFASITLDTDAGAGGNENHEKDSKLGISGDFGTFVFGRMEDFTEGKVMSMMTLNGTGDIEAAGNASRTDDAIAYVSPTVAGFHVGVAGYAASGDADAFDATNVAIFYDNGPLSIKIANEDNDAGSTTAWSSLAIGASYTIGDLKLSAVTVDWDDYAGTSTNDSTDFMARLDYTMGNNKITIAGLDDETTAGAAGTDVVAVEVTHTLSSRTSMYAGMTDSDAANSDKTYVGMIHKF